MFQRQRYIFVESRDGTSFLFDELLMQILMMIIGFHPLHGDLGRLQA